MSVFDVFLAPVPASFSECQLNGVSFDNVNHSWKKRPFRFDIRACTMKHYGFEMCSIFEQSVHFFVSLFHWLKANTLAYYIIHNVFFYYRALVLKGQL
jgi:hypothetical protein